MSHKACVSLFQLSVIFLHLFLEQIFDLFEALKLIQLWAPKLKLALQVKMVIQQIVHQFTCSKTYSNLLGDILKIMILIVRLQRSVTIIIHQGDFFQILCALLKQLVQQFRYVLYLEYRIILDGKDSLMILDFDNFLLKMALTITAWDICYLQDIAPMRKIFFLTIRQELSIVNSFQN